MKNKKLKVLISLLLASTMLLAACGTTEKKPESSQVSEGSVKQESESSVEEEVTLTTVFALDSTWKFEEGNPDRASMEENVWMRAYKEQLGLNIEYLWTPNREQYAQKWNAALATGDIPDFAVVDETIYKQLVEADLVMDMTDIFEEYASEGYKARLAAEDNLAADYMTFEGRLLGLPVTGTTSDGIMMMFIRKDWLDAVNKDVPTTIDELEDVMKAFMDAKLGGDDTIGFSTFKSLNNGIHSTSAIMEGFGAYYDIWIEGDDGKLVYSSTTEEMKNALLELQKMYNEGMIRQDFATLDDTQAAEDVVSGKCGVVFGTYWAPLNSINDSILSDPEAEWIVCDVPTVDGTPYKSAAAVKPYYYMFVSKDCEHPEAVMKLVNFGIGIDDSNDVVNNIYGNYEGWEHFKYRLDGGPGYAWANLNTYKAVKEALESGSECDELYVGTYDAVVAAMEGDRSQEAMRTVFGPENSTYKIVGELKDENRIVTSAYTSFNTDTMLERGNDLRVNLDAAMQKVIMGADISIFDEAVETWKSTGGDTITEEVNAWYTAQ